MTEMLSDLIFLFNGIGSIWQFTSAIFLFGFLTLLFNWEIWSTTDSSAFSFLGTQQQTSQRCSLDRTSTHFLEKATPSTCLIAIFWVEGKLVFLLKMSWPCTRKRCPTFPYIRKGTWDLMQPVCCTCFRRELLLYWEPQLLVLSTRGLCYTSWALRPTKRSTTNSLLIENVECWMAVDRSNI